MSNDDWDNEAAVTTAPSKPARAAKPSPTDAVEDEVKPASEAVFFDFDEAFAEEIEDEPQYKQFRYKGRVWHALPAIGVGSVRKLVRAEKKGDTFATIAFLATIVIEEDWEEVVDRMPAEHAGKIVAELLKQYGGDQQSGK